MDGNGFGVDVRLSLSTIQIYQNYAMETLSLPTFLALIAGELIKGTREIKQYSDNLFILFISYPTISPIPFMPFCAIGAKNVRVWKGSTS